MNMIEQEKKIHIWEGNGSRAYLDSIGLTENEEDDLGPIYGFQWRHFGADYHGRDADYTNQGVDQLAEVIHLLKTDPYNRRILLTAWNPSALHKMALPPCHVLSQFYVQNGYLSCQMYQRSADIFLGVPFNIASYALLLMMVAQVTDLQVGEFIHTLGDAHIYKNHLEQVHEQLSRQPRALPTMKLNPNVKDIFNFHFEDFSLEDYNPHPHIKGIVAV